MTRLLVLLAVVGSAAALIGLAVVTRPDAAGPAPIPEVMAATDAASDTATTGDDAATAEVSNAAAKIENLGPRKDLVDLDGWLQDDGVGSLDGLVDGKVAVIQIWTFSCSNCKATIPNLQALRDRFADNPDFQIVGIHSPEFDFEEDPDNILAAAQELGVTWPIALDTRKKNFFGWQGRRGFWPHTYVVDRNGDIRFDHVGEGAYEELNSTVATLLAG